MISAPAQRRGSARETWRLLSGSAAGTLIVMLAVFLSVAAPAFAITMHGKAAIGFVPCAIAVLVWFAMTTLMFEIKMRDQLAFVAMVPQPVDARRLVVVPMYVLGPFLAIVTTLMARLPLAAAPALVGIAWWSIAAVRWARRLPSWLELPVLLAAFAATYLAYRFGGWGGAGAVAIAFGIGALPFQPRVFLDAASAPGPAHDTRVASLAPVPGEAVSRPAGHAVWLTSVFRYLLLHTAQAKTLTILMLTSAVVASLTRPIQGMALFPWLLLGPVRGVANTPEMFDFINTRPVSRAQRFVGDLLLPLLIVLVVPVLMTAAADLEQINNGTFVGRLLHFRPNHDQTLGYMRDALGATFLPAQWPAGGLTTEMWQRVRPLLWMDLLRMTTLMVTAMVAIGSVRGRGSWLGIGLYGLAVLCTYRLSMTTVSRLTSPPLWFTIVLAVAAIASFVWRARQVRADAPTDSSTPG